MSLQNALSERGIDINQIDLELSSSLDINAINQTNLVQSIAGTKSASDATKATREINAENVTGINLKNFKINS